MNVLITRAEPAASQTAERLKENGFDPVVYPLFELADMGQALPTNTFSGIIFTSANAVRILDNRNWRNTDPELVAYCVGETTRKAAEKIGFSRFVVSSGGGAELVKHIHREKDKRNQNFLYPTTPDRSFDMARALKETGHTVTTVEVYKVLKHFPESDTFTDTLSQCQDGAVLIYSERSGHHLRDILEQIKEPNLLNSMNVIGISHSSINMLLDLPWRNAYVADHPNEKTMIRLLGETVTG